MLVLAVSAFICLLVQLIFKPRVSLVFLAYILMIALIFLELFDIRGRRAKLEESEF